MSPSVTEQVFNRGLTAAPFSYIASMATFYAFEDGFIEGMVLDWGCGNGRDVFWLESKGLSVIGYDRFLQPLPAPESLDFSPVRTILLNFVLNVIEVPAERQQVLREIYHLAKNGTNLLLTVRTEKNVMYEATRQQWQVYDDGFLTANNIFQKGFAPGEVEQLLLPGLEIVSKEMTDYYFSYRIKILK